MSAALAEGGQWSVTTQPQQQQASHYML